MPPPEPPANVDPPADPPSPPGPPEPSIAEHLEQFATAFDERLTAFGTTITDALGRIAPPAPPPAPPPTPAPPAPQDPPHDRRPDSLRDRIRRGWFGY